MAALALQPTGRPPRLRLRLAPPRARDAAARRPAAPPDPVADFFLIDGESLPAETAAALAEALREPELPRDGLPYAVGGLLAIAALGAGVAAAVAAARAATGWLA